MTRGEKSAVVSASGPLPHTGDVGGTANGGTKMSWVSRLGKIYSLVWLRRDLVAGLTVAAVAVPQAMAYALIAGLPPEYGLYTAIVMTAIGSLFGSSYHLINGPTNAISLVVFSALAGVNGGVEGPDVIKAVFLLALLVGLVQILIAILKLGDLTRYVSDSVVLGFMTGAGILVALGQVDNFLGLQQQGARDQHFLVRLWLTLTNGGPVNFHALAVAVCTVAFILFLRRLSNWVRFRIPDMLLALVLVSLFVWAVHWAPVNGQPGYVKVIGEVPAKLPSFSLPSWRPDWIRQLSGSVLAIALLGLLEALAIAKSIASHTRQPLDYNRQCLAEGLANIGGALFQCMPGSGSLTRSAINFHAGAATRVSGVLSALAVAGVLLLCAPLARYVPKPALAGILLVTAWRLIDKTRLRYCLRATRFDAALALATAGVAIFISIEFSILIGTFLSFLFFVPRAAKLQAHELVVSEDRVIRERQPDDPQCTLMALFSLEGELFFGAAPELDEHLAELVRRAEQGARIVVLRLKRVRNPDMVCLERLQHFLQDMNARKVKVLLCGVRPDFAAALNNLDFSRWLPPEYLFLEEAAVGSSTLHAMRKAYELLGNDRCATCPRPRDLEKDRADWYYVI